MKNILKQHGIEPAPDRVKKPKWKEFLAAHRIVCLRSPLRAQNESTSFGDLNPTNVVRQACWFG